MKEFIFPKLPDSADEETKEFMRNLEFLIRRLHKHDSIRDGVLTLGSTELNEDNLQALLALL